MNIDRGSLNENSMVTERNFENVVRKSANPARVKMVVPVYMLQLLLRQLVAPGHGGEGGGGGGREVTAVVTPQRRMVRSRLQSGHAGQERLETVKSRRTLLLILKKSNQVIIIHYTH